MKVSLACIIHKAQDFGNKHLQQWENLCCRFRQGAFTPNSRLALRGGLKRPESKPERFIIQKLPVSSWIVRARKSIPPWYFIFDSVIFGKIRRCSDRSYGKLAFNSAKSLRSPTYCGSVWRKNEIFFPHFYLPDVAIPPSQGQCLHSF